jgi:hypothetical protein
MVMVNVYGKLADLGVLPDLVGIGPATGIALPVPHGRSRCRVPLQTHEKIAQSDPMRIWGPHKNSRIRIQESGSGCIRI